MKMRDVAEVALSVMGVYRIVGGVVALPSLVWAVYMQAQPGMAAIKPLMLRNVGECAVNLVCGALLLLLAGRIASWLARRSAWAASADLDLRIVSREGFRFCLKLIGISLLITAATTLVAWDTAYFISAALTLALGLYLLLGGGWLARLAWGKAAAEPRAAGGI